jgi:hypothetical protein
VKDSVGTQQVLDELQFGVGWPDPEQVDVDRQGLVELLAGERPPNQVDIGQIELMEDRPPRGDMVGVAPSRPLDCGRGPLDDGDPPAASCSQIKRHGLARARADLQDLVMGETSSSCTAHRSRSGTRGSTMGRG